MTVPAPRGHEAGTDERSLFLTWMQRIEGTMTEGFRDLTASISKLRDESVHRREFDRYRDERTLADREEQQRVDKAIDELREAHQRADEARIDRERQAVQDRRVDWRWRIGLAFGAAVSFGAALLGAAHPFR